MVSVWTHFAVTSVSLQIGDYTYLVHCNGRLRGQVRARVGARDGQRSAKHDRSLSVYRHFIFVQVNGQHIPQHLQTVGGLAYTP